MEILKKVCSGDCDIDNRINGNIHAKTENAYISGTVTDMSEIPTANLAFFDHGELDTDCKSVQAISTMIDTRKWKRACFDTSLATSGCPLLTQSLAVPITDIAMSSLLS